ncbi:hypothetical protein CathTA2_1589 [Caldalkalibacillus thermarum TA2.A1]|uniref:Uncharacterized protein n=1 Tax=Caldalkalibacillus thermarum (strain TA2.A1) TaxID=986075 RepID=F5L6Y9_CALTT|nr:hypothetical protein [Caldalkalibacillus thermarum]EGL82877.1 hypothetical protein CathTA2_1589 [Caldalkalibacillus thermarum TA2.A1]GGK25133.1 hypothetical protein GCM10010965_17340 [Caldalkalibacillus thermarum]
MEHILRKLQPVLGINRPLQGWGLISSCERKRLTSTYVKKCFKYYRFKRKMIVKNMR